MQTWFTTSLQEQAAARQQYERLTGQITADNTARRVRVVLTDMPGSETQGLFEFTLAKCRVRQLRGGVVAFCYILEDGQRVEP